MVPYRGARAADRPPLVGSRHCRRSTTSRASTPSSSAPEPAPWASWPTESWASARSSSGRSTDPLIRVHGRLRRHRPRRRARGADPRHGGDCAARARRPHGRVTAPGEGDRMTDAAPDHFILFAVAGTTYALPSQDGGPRRNGGTGHAGAQCAAVMSTASCSRAGRSSRPSTCARASGSSARRADLRTRLLVVQDAGPQRRAARRRVPRVPAHSAGGGASARRGAGGIGAAVHRRHRHDRRADDRRCSISTNC